MRLGKRVAVVHLKLGQFYWWSAGSALARVYDTTSMPSCSRGCKYKHSCSPELRVVYWMPTTEGTIQYYRQKLCKEHIGMVKCQVASFLGGTFREVSQEEALAYIL